MPREEGREPQSYGSQADWTTGNTGEAVNRTDLPTAEHADFYDSRRESETSAPNQGGRIQPAWTDEVDVLQPIVTLSEVEDPSRKVSAEKSGARRTGFFKRRDYE